MDFKVTDKIGSTLNQGSIKLNLKDSAGIKSALNREKSDTSDIKKVSEGAATEDASTLTISNIKNYKSYFSFAEKEYSIKKINTIFFESFKVRV